jgi:UDP-N-acetylmuramoylalanine--D-glutamate ligase
MDAYRDIKQGLLQRSKHAVLNADDADLKSRQAHWPDAQWVSSAQTNHEPFNLELWVNPEGFVCNKKGALFPANALAMPGEHNRQNMLLVTAAALQATNYDAAAVALQAVPGPIILLAGGLSKQGDASGWLQLLQDKVCSIALFGSDRDVLSGLIRGSGYTGDLTSHPTMTDAVTAAVEKGKNGNASSLLLSPACASFDQYRDFEARGNHFREMIEQYSHSPSTRAN